MNRKELFAWETAHTWALSKDQQAVAGMPTSPWTCPLARCFKEVAGAKDCEVISFRVLIDGEKFIPQPWIGKVMRLVDKLPGNAITYAQFVGILEQVKAEEEQSAS